MRHCIPLALLATLSLAGTQRAADPPATPQAEIANALKTGQPASQRLGAAVLIGELAAAGKIHSVGDGYRCLGIHLQRLLDVRLELASRRAEAAAYQRTVFRLTGDVVPQCLGLDVV